MDGWRFLHDLHDALFGWMGWPTFRQRRVEKVKSDDLQRRLWNVATQAETIRDQNAQLSRLLDGLTEHCQDLNTEIDALVERETVLSNRITELESRESTLDQAEKDVIAAADQLAAEREQWELQFK